MSESRPASSIGVVTLVPRTTRTSRPLAAMACVSDPSLRSGSEITSQPAAFSPSRPLVSNLSAIRTFIAGPRPTGYHKPWLVSYGVNQQPIPKLRLEPCGLRGHDAAFVRDRHQILDRHRMHREGGRRL